MGEAVVFEVEEGAVGEAGRLDGGAVDLGDFDLDGGFYGRVHGEWLGVRGGWTGALCDGKKAGKRRVGDRRTRGSASLPRLSTVRESGFHGVENSPKQASMVWKNWRNRFPLRGKTTETRFHCVEKFFFRERGRFGRRGKTGLAGGRKGGKWDSWDEAGFGGWRGGRARRPRFPDSRIPGRGKLGVHSGEGRGKMGGDEN